MTAVIDGLLYLVAQGVGYTIQPWMYLAGAVPLTVIGIEVMRSIAPVTPKLRVTMAEARKSADRTRLLIILTVTNSGAPTALREWRAEIKSGGHTYRLPGIYMDEPYPTPYKNGKVFLYHHEEQLVVKTMSPLARGDIIEGWILFNTSETPNDVLNDPGRELVLSCEDASGKKRKFEIPPGKRGTGTARPHPGMAIARGTWEVAGDPARQVGNGESGTGPPRE